MIYDPNARRHYKQQAQMRIREQLWLTIGSTLLYMVPVFLISYILQIGVAALPQMPTIDDLSRFYKYIAIYLAATLFIGAPLKFGIKQFWIARARGRRHVSLTLAVSGFSNAKSYLTSLKLQLCILLRSLGWSILLGVYMVLVISLQTISLVLGILAWIIFIPLAIFVSVKIRRYDGAYIRMTDTPDASVWQAVKACVPIFKNHNCELFMFDLSFILWGLLTVVTAGIAIVYAAPYQEMAFTLYFDDLCRS